MKDQEPSKADKEHVSYLTNAFGVLFVSLGAYLIHQGIENNYRDIVVDQGPTSVEVSAENQRTDHLITGTQLMMFGLGLSTGSLLIYRSANKHG